MLADVEIGVGKNNGTRSWANVVSFCARSGTALGLRLERMQFQVGERVIEGGVT